MPNLPAELKTRGWNTLAGSDPRSPKGFWRDTRAKIWGRSRPQKVFSRVRITGVVQGLFLSFQVLAGAGSGTRSGTIGGMSVSTHGSTSALAFVDRNVVENVVRLGQKMGLEGHLWSLGTGVDEGVDLGWAETFGRPVLIDLVEQVPWYR